MSLPSAHLLHGVALFPRFCGITNKTQIPEHPSAPAMASRVFLIGHCAGNSFIRGKKTPWGWRVVWAELVAVRGGRGIVWAWCMRGEKGISRLFLQPRGWKGRGVLAACGAQHLSGTQDFICHAPGSGPQLPSPPPPEDRESHSLSGRA